MILIDLRRRYFDDCVLGQFELKGQTFYTIERPWLGNKPYVSCIPESVYECVRVSSARHGDTVEIVGVPDRFAILFHIANKAADVQGCIGIGTEYSYWGDELAVSGSTRAMTLFRTLMEGENDIVLAIRNHCGG